MNEVSPRKRAEYFERATLIAEHCDGGVEYWMLRLYQLDQQLIIIHEVSQEIVETFRPIMEQLSERMIASMKAIQALWEQIGEQQRSAPCPRCDAPMIVSMNGPLCVVCLMSNPERRE